MSDFLRVETEYTRLLTAEYWSKLRYAARAVPAGTATRAGYERELRRLKRAIWYWERSNAFAAVYGVLIGWGVSALIVAALRLWGV